MGRTADLWPYDSVPWRTMGATPSGEALEELGLWKIGEYIKRRHNIVSQYIDTWPIFYIEVTEERRTGSPEIMRWWE